jgi:hypothetical protein
MQTKKEFSLPLLLCVAGLGLSPCCSAAEGQLWSAEAFVTAESCQQLTYADTLLFVNNHYAPAMAALSSSNNVESSFSTVYTLASTVLLRSQLCLAEALELKTVVEQLQQGQVLMQSGTSFGKNEIQKQRELSHEADLRIKEAAAQISELTPEQKQAFSTGVATYMAGAYSYLQMIKLLPELGQEAAGKTRGLLDLGTEAVSNPVSTFGNLLRRNKDGAAGAADAVASTSGAVFITQVLPDVKDQSVEVFETSQYLGQVVQDQGIELPADATDKLGEVMDWQ